MNASIVTCGSCSPRTPTTSARDGSTVSGSPLHRKSRRTPKWAIFSTLLERAASDEVLTDDEMEQFERILVGMEIDPARISQSIDSHTRAAVMVAMANGGTLRPPGSVDS